MKKLAIAFTITAALGACGNTNVPYTKTQGAFGGGLIGATIGNKDTALAGAVIGILTANPCERVIRDNLNTPGIDRNGVACDGIAATGYNINDRTPVLQQPQYRQNGQRRSNWRRNGFN